MSARGQLNSRSRKSRDKKVSRVRDSSQESTRSEVESSNIRSGKRDDGKRKEPPRTRISRSPRKGRENAKDNSVPDKSSSPSTKSLPSRKEDSKQRGNIVINDKGRDTTKSLSNDRHTLFQDNSRLAILIGQITNIHGDSGHRLKSCKQFGEYIQDPSNFEHVRRSCSNIFAALEDVFKERGHNEIKDQVILCLGSIGQLLGINAERFFKWVFSKVPDASNDQLRVLYLRTVLEALKLDSGKQTFYDSMPRVMASLQDILENADAPELLLVNMDIISIVSADYPEVFETYFKDTVDILVGWHIDITQSEDLLKSTSECLIGFHPYWVADMEFSVTLLSQFIEDMEAYSEGLKSIYHGDKKDEGYPLQPLPKLNSLVSVFATVVTGIGDFIVPGRGCLVTTSFITETVKRIIQCVDITGYQIQYEKLLISANKCLKIMIGYLSSHFASNCQQVATFVMAQLDSDESLSYTHLTSILALLETMINRVGVSIPVKVIDQLFNGESPLYQLRSVNSNETYTILLKTFQELLSIKNIPIVQVAYKYLAEDLIASFAALKTLAVADIDEIDEEDITDAEGEIKSIVVEGEAKSAVNKEETKEQMEGDAATDDINNLTAEELQANIIFDLSVIAEIVTYKSAVIGAWNVSPTTFHLLTKMVTSLDVDISIRFPAVQVCIISTLYTHSQRANHFLHIGHSSKTIWSQEFLELMKILSQISSHPSSCADSRRLCMLWQTDIVRTLQGISNSQLSSNLTPLIDAQIISSFDVETSVVAHSALCLEAILNGSNISESLLPRILTENFFHLADMRPDIQKLFLNIIVQFPVDVITGLVLPHSQSNNVKHAEGHFDAVTCGRDIWLAKKCHMMRIPTGTLRSHHFKIVMGHILQGLYSKDDLHWIEKIYYACQRLGKVVPPVAGDVNSIQRLCLSNDSTLPTNSYCSEELLWFWATWEAAQFCVLARLKTPLGKATETFHAVEGVLKKLELNLRNGNPASVKTIYDVDEQNQDSESNSDKLRQSMLLLQFLESLEKLMYNAYEGATVSLPPSTRAARTFFRTNKTSCQEWLLRIREPACRLSSMVGSTAAAIRHGFSWLQSLKDSGSVHGAEFERAVVVVASCFTKLHAWESVSGLLEWCKQVAGRNLFWLQGLIAKSKGSLEKASEQLDNGLRRYLAPDRPLHEHAGEQKQKKIMTVLTKDPVTHSDPEVASFLSDQVLDCYTKLGDWRSVVQWADKSSDVYQIGARVNLSYVGAMAKFEAHDFVGVREELEHIPGATISSVLHEQFPVLGTVQEERDPKPFSKKGSEKVSVLTPLKDFLKPHEVEMHSKLCLLRALTLYWTSGLDTLKGRRSDSLHSSSWETLEGLLNSAKDSLMTSVRSFFLCGAPAQSVSLLMQLKALSLIEETLFAVNTEQEQENLMMKVSNIHARLEHNRTDNDLLNEALQAASYLQFHHSLNKKGWVAQSQYSISETSGISSLQVFAAKLARKQGNVKLAESLLAKQLLLSEGKPISEGKLPSISNAHLKLKQLSRSVHTGKVSDPLSAIQILRESAKLKKVLGHSSDAADTLCSSIILAERHHGLAQKTNDFSKLSEVSTRSVLTLVRWLLAEPKLLNAMPNEVDDPVIVGAKIRDILKIVVKTGGLSLKLLQNTSLSVISLSECDKVCGQLLHFATHRCPSLGKTWYAYAEWCYKLGRKAVEHASRAAKIELLDEEKEKIMKTLPENTKQEDVDGVMSVLSKAHSSRFISPDEDISTTELTENLVEDDDEKIKHQLLAVSPNLINEPSQVSSLISVWHAIVDRVFSHYKQASAAYFTFLKLGDNQFQAGGNAHSEYGNITATLRLLRLLVKYSGELKQELEVQLSQTPTKPWKGIIPQLFARLNHPEIYVQKSVAGLLCRIAKDFPHLIVYPTVVGCSDVIPPQLSKTSAAGILKGYQLMDTSEYCDQPQEDGDENAEEGNGDADSQEESLMDGVNDKVFQGSLHNILDSLSSDNLSLVSEVKTVVKELRRITLLWDELWIGSLMQLNHDAQRRIKQLKEEIQRVNSNQTLSATQKTALIKEKYAALMKPLVYSLERLEKITSQIPETKHEENFQKYFGKTIQKVIDKLKMPVDSSDPKRNWEPLKELHGALHTRTNRRSMSTLSMEEISPILAKGKFLNMPMPGIDFNGSQSVSLASFADDVLILPTKTKPKKLAMIGSDGQRYTYLFKGLEDLHLDERITQFLEICNHMFARNEKSIDMKFVARRYSVTPLGSRSGLIQWVDGSIPIFTLYKRWQQREVAALNLAKVSQAEKAAPVIPATALRPSELFYNKIAPLLKEKGIQDFSSSRKDWPLATLKKVFNELSDETPSDLLAKELWCSSTTATDWWEATKKYSRSVAVISMIGYVIGLGDRHLDNILIDLSTGEVVHIDYNVCFEKGKALRVAEKIPFRMTKNIQTALGLSGVEGLFRISCEKVLHILRQGRETLLTLLEAFVYDPLVDWTTANDAAFAGAFYGGGAAGEDSSRYSKKEMERGITQTLLSTRTAEMKVSWTSNRDELHAVLVKLEGSLDVYCGTLSQQWKIQKERSDIQHQYNVLKAAIERVDHPLHSLQARYDRQEKLSNNLKDIRKKLQDKIDECKQYIGEHKTGFEKVRSKAVHELYNEICKPVDIGTPCYGPVATFLQSAGQSNVIAQCDQMESELVGFFNQRRSALSACLDTLFSYATIVIQFPNDYASQTWCSKWIQWLQQITSQSTSENCSQVLKEHDSSIQRRVKSNKDAEDSVTSLETNLQQYFTDQNSKLVKLIERRNAEPSETGALSGPVTETWNAMRKFVGEAGVPGATSLACVTITALTTLNDRFVVMENAATVSGEKLMHLTSRDGDWFLDELCTMCGNISQLLSVLKNNPLRPKNNQKQETLDHISNCMHILFASVKVYGSFQELVSNFRTIIVPEALRAIQNGDESFIKMMKIFDEFVSNAPISCAKIVGNLQGPNRGTGEDENKEISSVVDAMRESLKRIMEPDEISENAKENSTHDGKMTPGQMLLAGFSGLFTKVETELSLLYDSFKKLQPNDVFENMDLSQDQKPLKFNKNFANSPFTNCLNLLFARRIQVIGGFFKECAKQAAATREFTNLSSVCNGADCNKDSCESEHLDKGGGTFSVFNEELLVFQVKQFVAECVQQFIVGLPSFSLTQLILHFVSLLNPNCIKDSKESKKGSASIDDLCKKAVEQCLKNSSFNHHHLNKASTLIHAHDVAWRKHDLARRLDSAAVVQKDIVRRAQLQLARFQWLHEDILRPPGKNHDAEMASPSRISVLSEIKKRLQSVSQIEQSFPNLMDRYTQLQSSIEQRLKWAAGANPALNLVQQKFEEAAQLREIILSNETKLSPEVTDLANSILNLETFRLYTQDAIAFDAGVVSIVQKCKECCEALEGNTGELGDVEQLMTNLQIPIPPKEPINVEWMKIRLDNADKKLKTLRTKERGLKSAIGNHREAVKSNVQSLKNLLTCHNALVGDVKSLLKTLAKDEEAPECTAVRNFITTHNKFSEDASVILREVLQLCSGSKTESDEKEAGQSGVEGSGDVIERLRELAKVTNWLHDQLLTFASDLKEDERTNEEEPQTFASALRNQTPPKLSDSVSPTAIKGQANADSEVTVISNVVSPSLQPKASYRVTSPKYSTPSVKDPKTGKAMQEKNIYAMNVWRRVKAKLEGKDYEVNHRMTVTEQVDRVIREATDVDNLCQLYEGWTPWV